MREQAAQADRTRDTRTSGRTRAESSSGPSGHGRNGRAPRAGAEPSPRPTPHPGERRIPSGGRAWFALPSASCVARARNAGAQPGFRRLSVRSPPRSTARSEVGRNGSQPHDTLLTEAGAAWRATTYCGAARKSTPNACGPPRVSPERRPAAGLWCRLAGGGVDRRFLSVGADPSGALRVGRCASRLRTWRCSKWRWSVGRLGPVSSDLRRVFGGG